LEAVPGTPLTGSVVDDAGRPVEGARVELRAAPRTRREVRTDASGTFRFESAPRGALSLTARAEGLVPARVTIEADGAAPRLTLGRGLVSTGAIVDADGAPVAGRWLDFVIDGENHLRREARTDEEGRFRVDGLADREYRVIALVRRDGDVARVPAGAIRGGAVDVALRLE
jgi:protocatechuate 3,4-dioxygenase beta subunit